MTHEPPSVEKKPGFLRMLRANAVVAADDLSEVRRADGLFGLSAADVAPCHIWSKNSGPAIIASKAANSSSEIRPVGENSCSSTLLRYS